MISINPVIFGTIKKTSRFAVNPQYINRIKVQAPLRKRMECTLRARAYHTATVPGNSAIEFVCTRSDHYGRFCANIKSSLYLTQSNFTNRNTSAGNILLQLYKGRCHSCGEDSSRCWLEYTGHRICATCVAKGLGKAPFLYGNEDRRCCHTQGCGTGLAWYSESNEAVYKRALEVYERNGGV